MIFHCILLFALVLGGHAAQAPGDTHEKAFTIYCIRHAEKNIDSGNPSNPELTACGKQRAEHLGQYFKNLPLERVYSTDLLRTRSTAQPTAQSQGLDIALYDPDRLEDFAKQLLEKQENALVVGHSNTTAALAGLLVGEQLGDIDLEVYNRIYRVSIRGKKKELQVLHSDFQCLE